MLQTELDFQALLPGSIAEDPGVMALAEATGGGLLQTAELLPQVRLYERIDELTEPALSLMAWQLRCFWWDPALPDATKRQLLRRSIPWRRMHGTPACVEEAVATVYEGQCRTRPWFEYDGEPGRFRLRLNLSSQGWTPTLDARVESLVAATKNVRSHLEAIEIVAESTATPTVASGCGAGELTTVWPRCPDGLEVRAGVSTTARLLGAEALTVWPLAITLGIAEGPGFAALCAAQSFDTVTVYPPDRYPEV